MMTIKRPSFFSLLVIIFFCFLGGQVVSAKTKLPIKDSSYSAEYVSQSIADPIEIVAGESRTVTLKFKNIGTTTWVPSGKRYISAATMEPRLHESDFRGKNWMSGNETAAIKKTVRPGEIAEIDIDLKAPMTPGDYTENFQLGADKYTWVKGGSFYLKIKVKASEKITLTPVKPEGGEVAPKSTLSGYRAKLFMQNLEKISAAGGEEVNVILGYENTGTVTWTRYGLETSPQVALAGENSVLLSLADESWQDRLHILNKSVEIRPGDIVRAEFKIQTPAKSGAYVAKFSLRADGQVMSDAEVYIPVEVTRDAPDHYAPPFADQEIVETPNYRFLEEPRIRVGLSKVQGVVQFVSNDDDYLVFAGSEEKGILPRGEEVKMNYKDGNYYFNASGLEFSTNQYIRLSPVSNMHAVFSIPTLKRTLAWKGSRNFNAYRGAFEFRKVETKNDLYVINDVLFEDYIAGIAETSDGAAYEYIKALLTAARTYSYYIKEYSDKHDERNFDVVASTGDQLYLGYESELLMPRVARAAKETRGIMITYDNQIVITPYYGNSDGRTRSWNEVWGGTKKPWLVSVVATYDKRDRKKKFGHGVGMSARDAAIRAEEEGINFEELLKYYYTGVALERVYE